MTLLLYGIILLIIAISGYFLPIDEGYSVPSVVGLCNSGMGQLGQAFSGDVVKACTEFNAILMGIYGIGIIGIILIIGGSALKGNKTAEIEEETSMKILKERYANGEITKEEFDEMKKNLDE